MHVRVHRRLAQWRIIQPEEFSWLESDIEESKPDEKRIGED